MGFLQFFAGLSLLFNPVAVAFLPIVSSAPIELWSSLWMACGVGGVVASLWPSGKDAWGFQLGYPMFLLWGIDVILAGVVGDFPYGMVRAVFGGIVYFGYVALVLVVAGMEGQGTYTEALMRGASRDKGAENGHS